MFLFFFNQYSQNHVLGHNGSFVNNTHVFSLYQLNNTIIVLFFNTSRSVCPHEQYEYNWALPISLCSIQYNSTEIFEILKEGLPFVTDVYANGI